MFWECFGTVFVLVNMVNTSSRAQRNAASVSGRALLFSFCICLNAASFCCNWSASWWFYATGWVLTILSSSLLLVWWLQIAFKNTFTCAHLHHRHLWTLSKVVIYGPVPIGAVLISDSRPSPRTSRSCKTTDMEPVCHIVACLLPSFHQYQFILLGDRGTWVCTTCLPLLPDSYLATNRTRDRLI